MEPVACGKKLRQLTFHKRGFFLNVDTFSSLSLCPSGPFVTPSMFGFCMFWTKQIVDSFQVETIRVMNHIKVPSHKFL